jgi:hypothetical protein
MYVDSYFHSSGSSVYLTSLVLKLFDFKITNAYIVTISFQYYFSPRVGKLYQTSDL